MNWLITLVAVILAIVIELLVFHHLKEVWKKCGELGCGEWVRDLLRVVVILTMLGIAIYAFASLHTALARGMKP
jgi:hypothetical protein